MASIDSPQAVISSEVVHGYAATQGVCVRPLLRQVSDTVTGEVEPVLIPCGSTREAVCGPCAEKARRLRMQQCAEGWHLEQEPLDSMAADEPPEPALEESWAPGRRVRSTRRRSDVADLPRLPVEHRSVGRLFTAPDGKSYRPSMFVTLTLGSYGKVIPAKPGTAIPGAGSPVNPATYNYRQAGIEALLFPRLVDRWVQNLRRCAGYRVQYFGAIETQRRLAPHIHLALRGAIPRQVIRAVTQATYLQLWWPPFDIPVYVDQTPVWDPELPGYRDPATGIVLPTWEQALDRLDAADAAPAVVLRFGSQVDIKGIIAPSADADRSIRYLTKYLTKSVADTYTDPDAPDAAYQAHIDRLHDEVRWLPCTPECANWLRYGVQPRNAGPGLTPGRCPSKAHDRENLGLGGRRVQVSRHWSGKTLTQHRADRAAVVRAVLAEAGIDPPATDRKAAAVLAADGTPRFLWDTLPVRSSRDYLNLLLGSVLQTQQWRDQYQTAKQAVAARASPRAGPVDANSATTPPRPPVNQPPLVA
jgi:hypothetical protein